MSKEYLSYWKLSRHPFHLAPDSEMMYMGGQYYECYERLIFAVNTNKGGALVVSEEAGLGKTTILMKLIAEMEEENGGSFRYAFIEHPILTMGQMLSEMARGLSFARPSDDKFKNLTSIKEGLTDLKKAGGKAVIIIDEAHMLYDRVDVLQEMRTLLNLTYNREYLFTMILSGQRPLWNGLRTVPEFWQRLPVKYYLTPLRLNETGDLINHRLSKAGFDEDEELFTPEAIEAIQRFSQGLPRTILALSDIALLIGASYHTRRIGVKEVSKAIQAMSGKTDQESLPFVSQERMERHDRPLDRPDLPQSEPPRPTAKQIVTADQHLTSPKIHQVGPTTGPEEEEIAPPSAVDQGASLQTKASDQPNEAEQVKPEEQETAPQGSQVTADTADDGAATVGVEPTPHEGEESLEGESVNAEGQEAIPAEDVHAVETEEDPGTLGKSKGSFLRRIFGKRKESA